ncbi:hypothetical protein BCR32DRAFT_295787 [Anaeromyces robustus]|uniref:Uncharacterized protein n=1 Tax=Anaeromyces robustus TaxID=1754192 RepID=A0A1Y1WVL1_9FUNG|nr:hypothetical protein BCR32DRAFT_295787 [Anaeromyces robustus]|eukprot:ORX77164.1 hypothetical protein BCR32DRAFT_295787 [Anaeromyces robustus]
MCGKEIYENNNHNHDKEWEEAYIAKPHFYSKDGDKPFGSFALTEETLTSLLKNPKASYRVDNNEVEEWKLTLISTTLDDIIDSIDYYTALEKLQKYVIDENDKYILVRGLTLEELKEII